MSKETKTPATIAALKLLKANDKITRKLMDAHLQIAAFSAAERKIAINIVMGEGSKATGFKAMYYEFLAEKERSEEEATAYIMGDDGWYETSPNIQKNKANFLGIWALTVAIHKSK